MRKSLKLLAILLVLVILGAAADFVGARVFEQRAAAQFQAEYGLEETPVVQVRDVPFLLSLARGRFGVIDVAARDVSARGVTVEELEIHLRDVEVPREVMLGGSGQVVVGGADGRVKLSEAELNRLVRSQLQGGRLDVTAEGVRVRVSTQLLGRPIQVTIDGRLGVEGGAIVFTPAVINTSDGSPPGAIATQLARSFTFRYRLPSLPVDVNVERVTTEPGAVVLAGRVGTLSLQA